MVWIVGVVGGLIDGKANVLIELNWSGKKTNFDPYHEAVVVMGLPVDGCQYKTILRRWCGNGEKGGMNGMNFFVCSNLLHHTRERTIPVPTLPSSFPSPLTG